MSWRRLRGLMRKELIQLRRDRRAMAQILALPALALLLFGYALNTVTDHMAMTVYDQSQTASSRALVHAFQNTGYFDVALWASSREQALRTIDDGTARVALIVPPEYGDAVLSGATATAQLLVDGSDPNVAQTASLTGGLVAQAVSGQMLADAANRRGSGVSLGAVELRPVVLYNPRLQSPIFMVPGIIGLMAQMQAVLLTAFAVVRERERGTLEQLLVTPVTSSQCPCSLPDSSSTSRSRDRCSSSSW
jgi:ABC-2 type transport system permease protein